MKKILQYSIVIIITGCVFFPGCTKEDPATPYISTPPPPPPPPPPPSNPPAITNVQLIEFGNLSQGRYHLLAASAGNKMLFVGGRYFVPNAFFDSSDNTWWNAEYSSTRVDIYDTSTHTWSIAELDRSNYDAWSGVATIGNKIFFTGGYGYSSQDSARIDIYDAGSNSWSFINLPFARHDISIAALGTKVFFAGGGGSGFSGPSNRVDIYDVSNNAWSTATLSEPRVLISGVSFANKIFFAGGYPLTTRVDIYDGATQSWSTAELSVAKYLIRTATAGNKLLFDGGDGNLSTVDIYNDSTQGWSSVNVGFPVPFHFRPTASLGNNAFCFMYSSQVNIYNSVSNVWSIASITPTNTSGHKAAITVGNQIYLAGGFNGENNTNRIWKVQF